MENKQFKYLLDKVRKSSNVAYNLAIRRNKANKPKNPPLINLLRHLDNQNTPEIVIDRIVMEYWEAVEKDPKFEKEIADKIRIKHSGKV